jgi:transposase-like protein
MVKFNETPKKEQQDMKCPQCGEDKTVKNGSLTNGKPKYKG